MIVHSQLSFSIVNMGKCDHFFFKKTILFLCSLTTKKIAICDGPTSSQQHRKLSQISIADGKRPLTAVGKSLVDNIILLMRPSLTLIFDSTTPS